MLRSFMAMLLLVGTIAIQRSVHAQTERVLAFSDDFDGDRLHPQWTPVDPFGEQIRNDENELAYANDAETFVVDNGVLRIVAWERPTRYAGEIRDFTSGMMSTAGAFMQSYGKWEVRVRMPQGPCGGLLPAVWMVPVTLDWPPEIDIVEYVCQEPMMTWHSLHHGPSPTELYSNIASAHHLHAVDSGFHTYTLLWEPGRLEWYVDGVRVHLATTGVPEEPMILIINLAVGGEWPGPPPDTMTFPAEFQIDYVKVWSHPK